MDSREFGLVIAQQLTSVEDLHYGFWDEGTQATFSQLQDAQTRYTNLLIDTIESYAGKQCRILDVGCGTGKTLARLLERGHQVDGVIPADYLKKRVEQRLATIESDYQPVIFPCLFEEMPPQARDKPYDLILFSESFQYVPLHTAFNEAKALLKPGGYILICDFFKTENDGDGGPGDKSFGGGHPLKSFYHAINEFELTILKDDDITRNTSQNIDLIDRLLTERIGPAMETINIYLSERKPALFGLLKWVFRKKIARNKFKYFSGHRSQATFERYKSYHLTVLQKQD